MTAATDCSAIVKYDAAALVPYRAISRSAVISIVVAGGSALFVLVAVISAIFASNDAVQAGDPVTAGFLGAGLALVAAVLGVVAVSTIRRYPTEYTGQRLATCGLVGGLALFATGSGISSYSYVSEVPDDHIRVGFWELQPDPDYPLSPIPPKALEIAGEKIFIKGYMHPGVAGTGKVNHFILVPDMGTCCFGGQPKPTDMIEVRIRDNAQRVAYSTRKLKLAGTFRLSDRPRQSLGLSNVWYHLEVE